MKWIVWPAGDPAAIARSALMAAQAVHGEQNDQARMNPKSVSGDPK